MHAAQENCCVGASASLFTVLAPFVHPQPLLPFLLMRFPARAPTLMLSNTFSYTRNALGSFLSRRSRMYVHAFCS